MLFRIITVALLLLAVLAVSPVFAQNMWGTGMYGGMQGCGQQPQMSDEASGVKEEIQELAKNLKEAKSDLSRLKSKISSLKSGVSSAKDLFKMTGFESEAFSTIENHITGAYSCQTYQRVTCGERETPAHLPPSPPPARNGTPQSDPCGGAGALTSPSPFAPEVWAKTCAGSGQLRASICDQNVNRPAGYNADSCRKYLSSWMEKQKELRESETKIAELEARVKEFEAQAKVKKNELRDALKEAQRSGTEGGCVECMLSGNSGRGGAPQQQRSSGWEVATNVALGLGSMYLGNQLQKYQTDQNARLGYPTQSYPTLGYGMPYFQGALYGALGGGTSQGTFACGGTMNGNGIGGAFGYPQNMYGQSGGGMMMSGMGNMYGMGMMGGMMMSNPMMGMMSNGMMSNGMMSNGMMSNGMMSNGMMSNGMMSSGMGMMNGMGMMSNGMMMSGMGMMNVGFDQTSMQFQQQMMQLQMQQYQQRTQAQMAGYQTIMGLSTEMQSLQYRYQQALMNIQTGGYLGYGLTGTGVNTIGTTGIYSNGLVLPGQTTTVPTTLYPATTTTIPSYR